LVAFAISGRCPRTAGGVTLTVRSHRGGPQRAATSPPAPHRFIRQITVFVRNDDGSRRHDDGQHGNVLIDTAHGPGLLAREGVEVSVTSASGAGQPPTGLAVFIGRRAPTAAPLTLPWRCQAAGTCVTGRRSAG
jgi:hypothetical protein